MSRLAPSIQRLLDLPPEERRIGPFALDRVLGRGGFAPVCLAREVYGGTELRAAAVKLFPLEGPDAVRERVIAEARALCQVEHPNVVRFYALPIDEARGVMGLAMELAAGTSLQERLGEAGRLPVTEAIAVGAALASALAAVHRAGLVHRDVKPANVVFAAGVYKLIDFGIAAADELGARSRRAEGVITLSDLPREMIGTRLSSLGAGVISTAAPGGEATAAFEVACGTIGYIDPAIVARGAKATAASDLYALGVTLFECLTGRVPAVDPTTGRLRGDVLDGRATPPKLREAAPDAPEALAAIVDALLSPSRDARPASAAELLRAIEQLREVPARTKPSRRAIVPALAVLVAAIGAFAMWPPPRGGGEVAARSPPPPSPSLPMSSATAAAPVVASSAPSLAPPSRPSASIVPSVARSLTVPGGPSPVGAWLPAFSLRRDTGDEGLSWLAAAERCRDRGLALCTEAQWSRACEASSDLASIETWTASADGDRGFVVRGGARCEDRRVAAEPSAALAGVCCTRAIALRVRDDGGLDLAPAHGVLLAYEAANRQGGGVLGALLADPLRFYNDPAMPRRKAVAIVDGALARSPDFWALYDTCDVAVDQGTAWTADCRKIARQDGKIADVLTHLAWTVPGGITAIYDLKVFRPFSTP